MVEFSYDHDGLRTQKKVTGTDGTMKTTDYSIHGKPATHLSRGNDEMHFFYDEQKRPAMVDFNGILYSYIHNLQGDIVGIIDSNGSLVVEYKRDAWGKTCARAHLDNGIESAGRAEPVPVSRICVGCGHGVVLSKK